MDIDEWAVRFYRGLTPALAALDRCEDTCARQWAPALVANADQLRAAALGLRRWIHANPCPNEDLGMELDRLARSYVNAAEAIEDAVASGSRWLAVNRELRGLHRSVTRTVNLYRTVAAA